MGGKRKKTSHLHLPEINRISSRWKKKKVTNLLVRGTLKEEEKRKFFTAPRREDCSILFGQEKGKGGRGF